MEKAILRALIVDDFEPWRKFLLSTLQKLREFRVIGEESDGLSAVHRAEELRPDLIILDVSLPRLNGIEAARRIRKVSPDSKILFASADQSWETVEVALETGAAGYLIKTDAGSELLPAIKALLGGKQFVSRSVASDRLAHAEEQKRRDRPDQNAVLSLQNVKPRHEVCFYRDDIALANGFYHLIEASLRVGATAVAIATPSHHSQILERFGKNGTDIKAAIETERYVPLNVTEALEMVMVGEMPDAGLCSKLLGNVIARTAKAATANGTRVAICGEGSRILLQEGKADAAISLERIWDEITGQHAADTLCGYLWSAFPDRERSSIFRRVCAEHSTIHGVLDFQL